MSKEEFDLMEVKTTKDGWYYVTLFQFEKIDPESPDYIREWVYFENNEWDYQYYSGKCYVCFIHKHTMDTPRRAKERRRV